MKTLLLILFMCSPVFADECRKLAYENQAHIFIITDSDGPVYGYVELADVNKAWESSRLNWTKTIQGKNVEDVRSELAILMCPGVINNPNPPRIIEDELFGPSVEWDDTDDGRKSVYNISKWAPAPTKKCYKRTFKLSSTRD